MWIGAGTLAAGPMAGESVAQVSSQTLANLSVIDDVSQSLILRPLCASDKQEIINIAREIGTEQFSQSIPEYCAVISKKPTTKARKDRIEKKESRLDQSILISTFTIANQNGGNIY